MNDHPDHFCPGCGAAQKPFERYPWYFCQACVNTATDGGGRRLEFSNAGPMGGFVWRHVDAENWQDARQVLCLISGRPVQIGEARFGGVVAQPLEAVPFGETKGVENLTRT